MWFLLWLAWCWFVAPSRSVVTRGGWIWFRCHVLPGSAGILTLVAALLAGFGDAGLRCRSPCDALRLFRSHVSFVSVRVSVLLAALLLTDFWAPPLVPLLCALSLPISGDPLLLPIALVAMYWWLAPPPSPALLSSLACCVSSAVVAFPRCV
ncbi:hypothetical protein V6N13_034467 [Hibiscus sabdariffa]